MGRSTRSRVDFSLSSTTCSISWPGWTARSRSRCRQYANVVLVVHAAVDAVDRCLELVANEPRAHSGSLTLEMAIGGRCDRRRELVAPNSSVDWFLFPHVEGPSILAAILDPTEAADSNTVRLDRSKERNSTSGERPSSRRRSTPPTEPRRYESPRAEPMGTRLGDHRLRRGRITAVRPAVDSDD